MSPASSRTAGAALSAAFLLASLLQPTVMEAQTGAIEGLVTEASSGSPVPNAQVSVSGTGIGALTDASGRYRLLNVPTGVFSLEVQRIGYGSASMQVTVSVGGTTQADFQMSMRALALDEVLVVTPRLRLLDWQQYWILIWVFLTIELIWGAQDKVGHRGMDRRAVISCFLILLAVLATTRTIDLVWFGYLPELRDVYWLAQDATWWCAVVLAGVWGARRAPTTARWIAWAPLAAVAGAGIVTLIDQGIWFILEGSDLLWQITNTSAHAAAVGLWIGVHHRLPRPYGLHQTVSASRSNY